MCSMLFADIVIFFVMCKVKLYGIANFQLQSFECHFINGTGDGDDASSDDDDDYSLSDQEGSDSGGEAVSNKINILTATACCIIIQTSYVVL